MYMNENINTKNQQIFKKIDSDFKQNYYPFAYFKERFGYDNGKNPKYYDLVLHIKYSLVGQDFAYEIIKNRMLIDRHIKDTTWKIQQFQ